MPASTGKLQDPRWRAERARKAAQARTSLDHHIAKVVENAPALTAEQIDQLRHLLPPAPHRQQGAEDVPAA